MKFKSLFITTTALLFISACGQDGKPAADVAKDVTKAAEKAKDTTEALANMFATAPLIDPNTATAEVIAVIPGLDAALAQRVVAARPYATPSALHAVLKDDLDENTLKVIYSAMFVKVDLNTGSNADYQLIPTTISPARLAREFEEYRPYTSIDQFSREMSKYVSAEEVAFLQRYVVIN